MTERGRLRGGTIRTSPVSVDTASVPQVQSSRPVEHPAGVVGSGSLGLTLGNWWATADWTTTDTTNWVTVSTLTFPVPDQNYGLYFWTVVYAKHSVASATCQFRIQIAWDDSLVNSYIIQRVPTLTLVTAGIPFPVPMAIALSGKVNLPNVQPGKRTIYLAARNYTAGTLTVIGNAADTDVIPALSVLVTGIV